MAPKKKAVKKAPFVGLREGITILKWAPVDSLGNIWENWASSSRTFLKSEMDGGIPAWGKAKIRIARIEIREVVKRRGK